MATILLIIIYIASISLGLPDSLLGAAWPAISRDLEGSLPWAGVISMVISAGTILSILNSHRLIQRVGTGKVTVASVALTALALMGFSMSREFWHLCLWAVPYGLGAGCVDVAINSYVAFYYRSRHMTWLHALWGAGAAMGPLIMGKCLAGGLEWKGGYQITGILQIILTTVLFVALPIWEKGRKKVVRKNYGFGLTLKDVIRKPGTGAMLTAFFCYGALEITIGLWAAGYMVLQKGVSTSRASFMMSLFYVGIALGRFLAGFLADWMGDKNMIRIGQLIAVVGLSSLIFPAHAAFWMEGLLLTGLGLSPIYPGLLHSVPRQFGKEVAERTMSIQIVAAYVGSILMPPLFGILAEVFSIRIFGRYLLGLLLIMMVMTELMNRKRGI